MDTEAHSTQPSATGEPEPDTARESSAASGEPDTAAEPPRTSRRFPRLTRSTARPEGGGRAAPGDAPAPIRQWPLLAVCGGVATGLLVVAFGASRVGTLLIGLALIGGAVLRWTHQSVGMLAVRSRFTDIVTYGVLGVLILLLSLMIQPGPWLDIPWLKDVVHLTIR